MRCPGCGAWLREDDRFCPRCGSAKAPAAPRPQREHPWIPLAYLLAIAITVLIVGSAAGAFNSPKRSPEDQRRVDWLKCYGQATPCP